MMERHLDFETVVLPHLDAAYNLARWLSGNDHDAQDIAQEAMMRAFRFMGSFRGGNSRAWLLTIVRNTAYTWLKQNRPAAIVAIDDKEMAEIEDPKVPAAELIRSADVEVLKTVIDELPPLFREALILRELEGLSYKEIAEIADVPIGTVMSRLGRARRQFQNLITQRKQE